jgi:hypothetical protein
VLRCRNHGAGSPGCRALNIGWLAVAVEAALMGPPIGSPNVLLFRSRFF